MGSADFEGLLKQAVGLDAASIGSRSIERAVRARLSHLGIEHVDEYWKHVRNSSDEVQELIECVVVPETWFFRDREAFTAFVQLAIEEWRPARPQAPVRILSIPCSTGEEPYSMVMALHDGGFPADRIHVDAIDISARALKQAKLGVYGPNSFRGEDLTFRQRYFHATDDGRWTLSDRIAPTVHFRIANLASPDFLVHEEPYDIIFCRNLLIYFDRPLQERAMRTLHRLLANSGFLFVGPAEAFLASGCGFSSVNRAMSFAFRKISANIQTPSRPASQSASQSASMPSTPKTKPPKPRLRPLELLRCQPAHDSSPTALSASSPSTLEDVRRLADSGQFLEAKELCEACLRQHSQSSEAHYLLGLICDALQDATASAECYRKAIYLQPGHVEALVHFALAIERQGDRAAAERFRERARRIAKEQTDRRTE